MDDCAHGPEEVWPTTASQRTRRPSRRQHQIITLDSSVQAEMKEKSAGVYDQIREAWRDELVDSCWNAIDAAK